MLRFCRWVRRSTVEHSPGIVAWKRQRSNLEADCDVSSDFGRQAADRRGASRKRIVVPKAADTCKLHRLPMNTCLDSNADDR